MLSSLFFSLLLGTFSPLSHIILFTMPMAGPSAIEEDSSETDNDDDDEQTEESSEDEYVMGKTTDQQKQSPTIKPTQFSTIKLEQESAKTIATSSQPKQIEEITALFNKASEIITSITATVNKFEKLWQNTSESFLHIDTRYTQLLKQVNSTKGLLIRPLSPLPTTKTIKRKQ